MFTLLIFLWEPWYSQASRSIWLKPAPASWLWTPPQRKKRSEVSITNIWKKIFFPWATWGAYSNSRDDALVPQACRRRGKKFLFRGWTTGRLFKHFSDLCTASKSVCVSYPLTFSVCTHLSMWVYQTYLVHKPMLRSERRREQIFGEWNGFLPSLPLQKQSK